MIKYAIILERGRESYGASVPGLPGCLAVGESKAETLQLIRKTIELHLEALREDGEQESQPISSIEYVEVALV